MSDTISKSSFFIDTLAFLLIYQPILPSSSSSHTHLLVLQFINPSFCSSLFPSHSLHLSSSSPLLSPTSPPSHTLPLHPLHHSHSLPHIPCVTHPPHIPCVPPGCVQSVWHVPTYVLCAHVVCVSPPRHVGGVGGGVYLSRHDGIAHWDGHRCTLYKVGRREGGRRVRVKEKVRKKKEGEV